MEREIITELKKTLSDKLEQIRKFIDELLINKNSQRLTNVEYQQELKIISCPKCHGQSITKNGHRHGIQSLLPDTFSNQYKIPPIKNIA